MYSERSGTVIALKENTRRERIAFPDSTIMTFLGLQLFFYLMEYPRVSAKWSKKPEIYDLHTEISI